MTYFPIQITLSYGPERGPDHFRGIDERMVTQAAETALVLALAEGRGVGISVTADHPAVERRIREYLAQVGRDEMVGSNKPGVKRS